MAIRIFITGGTFDKEYNELTGELYFKDTHMSELLEKGRCKIPVEIRTLMRRGQNCSYAWYRYHE